MGAGDQPADDTLRLPNDKFRAGRSVSRRHGADFSAMSPSDLPAYTASPGARGEETRKGTSPSTSRERKAKQGDPEERDEDTFRTANVDLFSGK